MNELDALVSVLFGWFEFALRVFPQVSIRWDGIAVFGLAFLICLCCTRSFLNWLSRELSKRDASEPSCWSWLATGKLLTMILLVFVIGISLVGITHQAIWLGTSPETWYVSIEQSAADSARSIYQPGTIDPQATPGNWVTAVMPFTSYTIDDFGGTPLHDELPWNSPANVTLFRRQMPLLINWTAPLCTAMRYLATISGHLPACLAGANVWIASTMYLRLLSFFLSTPPPEAVEWRERTRTPGERVISHSNAGSCQTSWQGTKPLKNKRLPNKVALSN